MSGRVLDPDPLGALHLDDPSFVDGELDHAEADLAYLVSDHRQPGRLGIGLGHCIFRDHTAQQHSHFWVNLN